MLSMKIKWAPAACCPVSLCWVVFFHWGRIKAEQAGTIGILGGANNGDGANNKPVVDMVREQ